jgi:hypothetical protein
VVLGNSIYRALGHSITRFSDPTHPARVAQPFDAAALRTTGDPFPIAEQVGYLPASIYAQFAVSQTGVLAFHTGNLGINGQLTWVSRETRVVKKQLMAWTLRGTYLLLQTRTKVLHNEWEEVFRRWYPRFRAEAA